MQDSFLFGLQVVSTCTCTIYTDPSSVMDLHQKKNIMMMMMMMTTMYVCKNSQIMIIRPLGTRAQTTPVTIIIPKRLSTPKNLNFF